MTAPSPLAFFARLKWIDGRPLLDTIEPYRRELFMRALYEFRDDGLPAFNLVLAGRAKKNYKSSDLVLAGLYKLLIVESANGNDCLIAGNDEDQADQDLALAKKLIIANAGEIGSELEPLSGEIRRRDGRGSMRILPARNVIGQHGKTAIFLGFDEIHSYRNYDLFEALAPDPTRTDVLTWITSYDTIFSRPGVPLYDLKQRGIDGDDPRMLFSWYSGSYCTDPAFADLLPEQRANPSMDSWPERAAYLDQQRRRLPTHKFRRLHLNLPGSLSGAFLDYDAISGSTVSGRRHVSPEPTARYFGFVDMSGGSSDDATLAIAKKDGRRAIICHLSKQTGEPPFNPRHAVTKFAGVLKEYGLRRVTGDNYAGETFKADFADNGITYIPCPVTKTVLYEEFEPRLNAGEVELPDISKLQEQLQGLVVRGVHVDHLPGEHDDHGNAVAGAVWLALAGNEIPCPQVGTYSMHHAKAA